MAAQQAHPAPAGRSPAHTAAAPVLGAREFTAFPYPPYDIQQQFMANLYEALENRQIGLFESPTGVLVMQPMRHHPRCSCCCTVVRSTQPTDHLVTWPRLPWRKPNAMHGMRHIAGSARCMFGLLVGPKPTDQCMHGTQRQLWSFVPFTGTGKTLSVICSSLQWLEDQRVRAQQEAAAVKAAGKLPCSVHVQCLARTRYAFQQCHC